jgi:hypothetical protein
MTDNMRFIVIEERLARGLDVSAADLEFLARRKRKRSGESADDGDEKVCPTCGGSGRIRAVPDDNDDGDDDEKEARRGSFEDDE